MPRDTYAVWQARGVVTFDAGVTLAERFRSHMGHSSTLYGYAMRGMADDWEAGGPVREICRGWEDSPTGTMVQLRFLAAVFRIVLDGRAPELDPFYPCLGGEADAAGAWPVMHQVIAEHAEEIARALHVVPQTNEPGRASVLAVGLFEAVRRHRIPRVRLLEVGASGGLNLYADRFRHIGPGWAWGDPESPLTLDTEAAGVAPVEVEIVARRGCDLDPLDPVAEDGSHQLMSFVWPWQLHRHERLAGALAVARAEAAAGRAAVVDAAPAGEWLERQLAHREADALTVVWQSITEMYWPATESERVREAVAQAREHQPLAHITMEHPDRIVDGRVEHAAHAELAVDGDVLGKVHPHGIPLWLP